MDTLKLLLDMPDLLVAGEKIFPSPPTSHSGDSEVGSLHEDVTMEYDLEAFDESLLGPPPSFPETDVTLEDEEEEDYDETRVVTVLTILPKEKEVYKIHGATKVTGNLVLLVEWDTEERDLNLVDVKLLNEAFPEKVIEFYEKNLTLENER